MILGVWVFVPRKQGTSYPEVHCDFVWRFLKLWVFAPRKQGTSYPEVHCDLVWRVWQFGAPLRSIAIQGEAGGISEGTHPLPAFDVVCG